MAAVSTGMKRRGRPSGAVVRFGNTEMKVLHAMLANPDASMMQIAEISGIPLSTVQRKVKKQISRYLPMRRVVDAKAFALQVYVVKAKCAVDLNLRIFNSWPEPISAQLLHLMDGALVILKVLVNDHDEFLRFMNEHASWNFEVIGMEAGAQVDYPLNLIEHLRKHAVYKSEEQDAGQ